VIDFSALTEEHLATCAVSLGLPEDAFSPAVLAYLAKRIEDSAGPDACWPWTGPRQGAGYGIADIAGTTRGPHRLVHVLADGPLASRRLVVRHACDRPWCCNPAHLRRGTHQDNAADALARGRFRGTVLTDEDRDWLVHLVDRWTDRRRARMTRPEAFAFAAEVFEVSAAHAGDVFDRHRRRERERPPVARSED
jgi:hypothetical protein